MNNDTNTSNNNQEPLTPPVPQGPRSTSAMDVFNAMNAEKQAAIAEEVLPKAPQAKLVSPVVDPMVNQEGGNGTVDAGADANSSEAISSTDPVYNAPGTIPRQTIKIGEALAGDTSNPKEIKTGTVRTFQSDVAGAVKSDNVSMIKIALAEKERREHEGGFADVSGPKKGIKKAYVVATASLFVIAGALGFMYFYFNRPLPPTLAQQIAPNEPEIIYAERQVAISVQGKNSEAILKDLRNETLAKLDLGTIKRIFLTTGTGTSTRNTIAQEFFKVTRSRAGESLLNSLNPYYVIGVYSFEPHDIFIIFKVNSYDSAFAGMLEWEPAMQYDLGSMFPSMNPVISATTVVTTQPVPEVAVTGQETGSSTGSNIPGTISASTTTSIDDSTGGTAETSGTSTPTIAPTSSAPVATTASNGRVFRDRILQNKDVRALIDTDGRILFLYTFLDRETLLIASSEKALKEVISRTTTGRIRR